MMMKRLILFISLIITTNFNAQNVFEYNIETDVSFKVFPEQDGKFYKISKAKDFKQNTPEEVATSKFFAYSNEIASNLYFDKSKFRPLKEENLNRIKKIKPKDAYIQILHKMNYQFQGDEMAYIMYIGKIKDIPFPFPTVLSLIKKDNKWFIYQRPNQQKFTDCFMLYKSCVLSNIIEGKSDDKDVNNVIINTKSKNGSLDVSKLFDELIKIQKNEKLNNKLTIAQNLDCNFIPYKNQTNGKISLTGIYKNLKINNFYKQDKDIISLIKRSNNENIVLISQLEFDYSGKNYKIIKYKKGNIFKTVRLDKNDDLEEPVKNLIFLYKNLKTSIFKDLTPSLSVKPITKSELYKKTRGTYNILNISKLYNLYQSDKSLFSEYIQ